MTPVRTVAVIGMGLIGGSLGLALKQLARIDRVVGVSRHKKTVEAARIIGAIDAGFTDPAMGVRDADVVFIATPVSVIVDTARDVLKSMRPGAILTDVGSTKTNIVARIETMKPRAVHFVGGHPMAGSEMSGIEAADRDLFRNCAYILTPTSETDFEALGRLHDLLTRIGARVLSLDPVTHDHVAATISHLPHVLASALVNLAAGERREFENIFQIAAGGFYDATRIAASDPDIWADICLENRRAILDIIKEFQGKLTDVSEMIEAEDRARLKAWFGSSRDVRRGLKRGRPAEATEVYDLLIAVPNRPGVLSEITLAVGKIGINIEDIQIVHSTEGDSGTLKLAVFGRDEAERAAEILRRNKYNLSLEKRFLT